MPTSGVTNRKMKEILRLYHEANLSMHQIAKSLNLSSGVVCKYLKKGRIKPTNATLTYFSFFH